MNVRIPGSGQIQSDKAAEEAQAYKGYLVFQGRRIYARNVGRGSLIRDDANQVWITVEHPTDIRVNVFIPKEYKPGSVADQEAAMAIGEVADRIDEATATLRANAAVANQLRNDDKGITAAEAGASAKRATADLKHADDLYIARLREERASAESETCNIKWFPGPGMDAVFCHRSPAHDDEPFDNFPQQWHLDKDAKWSWRSGGTGLPVWPVTDDDFANGPVKVDVLGSFAPSDGINRAANDSFWINVGIDADRLPQHTQEILREIVGPAVRRWATKNVEYGDTANTLGSKGQFADINRKFGKLKRLMWDESVPDWAISEGVEEVLQDLIGHAILSIHYIREESERAKW